MSNKKIAIKVEEQKENTSISEYIEAMTYDVIAKLRKGDSYNTSDVSGHAFLISRILASNIPPKMKISKESMIKGVEIYFDCLSLFEREMKDLINDPEWLV